ncbi:MAG: hypothetical protein ACOCX4_07430 [Planctomycetota bacterium]
MEGVPIGRIEIRNPWIAGAIVLLIAAVGVYQIVEFAWDAYRPVDGIVVEKWAGEDDYFLRLRDAAGAESRKRVPPDVYYGASRGDRITKPAGFFAPVRNERDERARELLREGQELLRQRRNGE